MKRRTDIFITKMPMLRNILAISIALSLCYGQQPADKGANTKTKGILHLIAGLPKQGISILTLHIYFYLFTGKVNIFRVSLLELVVIVSI
jgi:hypothetical protein